MKLITIEKSGEPVLKIHPDALQQHLTLGWAVVQDDEQSTEEATEEGKQEAIAAKGKNKKA